MLPSDIGVFGRSSSSWDTEYARKFLQIPVEDLKKLNSIPGWSRRTEINKKQEKSDQIAEGPLSSQLKNPEETANQLQTIQNTNNVSSEFTQNSALPPRKKAKISSSADQQLFRTVSLCTNNEVEDLPVTLTPKDFNSAPDIYVLEEQERTSLKKSSGENISHNMSTLSQCNKSAVGKSLLDTTYVVPSVLDDKTNDIDISSDAQGKSPGKTSTKKRSFESPETDSPFPEEPVPKFGGLPVFPTNTISTQVGHENFLSKKLRLLEKRFSPAKDYSISPTQEATTAKVNLKSMDSHEMKTAENLNSPAKIRSQVNEVATLGNGTTADIPINVAAKKKEAGGGVELSEKEYAEVASVASNADVFEEESFVSQPIPCGQPPPKAHSLTQVPIKLQPSVKESVVEKANMPSSEKCSDPVEVPELASKVGRKRKLKSRGEHSSRKTVGVKLMVDIQYTAEQIKNMIEIMKMFY